MDKSYLQELLSEEVKNNPGLEKKLEKFLYQDKIDYIPSWIKLTTNTYKYLLDNGLDREIFLKHAILNDQEALDLALANKPDLSSISYEITDISTNNAQKLIELGLPAHILLTAALSIKQGERHDQLLDLALANKPNFSKLFYLQESISESDLEAMINSGCSATKILKLALKSKNAIELTYYFDYLITKGADLTKIYSLSSNLYFETYEDLLTKGLNPNALIDTINSLLSIKQSKDSLTFTPLRYIINKQNIFDLTKLAIDNGADISNIELPITSDIELIEFFLNHGVKCASGLEEITENGLTDIIFNPQKTIEQKFKNLDALKSSEAKIPYLLHHIWLTSLDNPKEIRDQDLKIVLQTKETFAKADIKWEQTVWTNDKNLFPKTVKILEDNGIQVKSIYDYKDNIALFDIIEGLIADQKWGMASDTLRYSLVNEFGGVYADLNFKFNRDTTDEAHKYNFFTQEYGGHYIDNFFFGASPHHPIMQEILKLVERNLVNPPEYISRIKDPDSSRITDMATANPTFIAYYGKANQNGNIDVVYPRNYNSDGYSKNTISRSIEEAEKVYSQYCPEVLWEEHFYTHPSPFNNMCIAEKFIIGEDSKDGRTWINEG